MNDIAKILQTYADNKMNEFEQDAIRIAGTAQGEMKTGARWKNESGKARKGLKVIVQRQGGEILIYYVHSVPYARELEQLDDGKFAILGPTFRKYKRLIPKLLAKGGG
jgi:hypothetical protein